MTCIIHTTASYNLDQVHKQRLMLYLMPYDGKGTIKLISYA